MKWSTETTKKPWTGHSLAVDQNPFPEIFRRYVGVLSRFRKGEIHCAGQARLSNGLQCSLCHLRVDGVGGVKDSQSHPFTAVCLLMSLL